MYNVINKYMNELTREKLDLLSKKNDIYLSDEELEFSYVFLKKNWNIFLTNPAAFDISKYKSNYSTENFIKIKNIYLKSINKYSKFL